MHELAEKYWRPSFDGRPEMHRGWTAITDFIIHWVTEAVHGSMWTIAYAVESLLLVRVGSEHKQVVRSVVTITPRHGRPVSGVPP